VSVQVILGKARTPKVWHCLASLAASGGKKSPDFKMLTISRSVGRRTNLRFQPSEAMAAMVAMAHVQGTTEPA